MTSQTWRTNREFYPALLEPAVHKKKVRAGDRVWIRLSGSRVGYGYVTDTIDEMPKVPQRFSQEMSYTELQNKNAFVEISYGNYRGWFMASSLAWGRIQGLSKDERKKAKEKNEKLRKKQEINEMLKLEEEEALRGSPAKPPEPDKTPKEMPRLLSSIHSEFHYRKFLQEKTLSAPSIADMMVLEVIHSQKTMRRRRAGRRDKKLNVDLLQFSSGGGANRKGADDEASDDACSIMSEIDLESSISWTPDPRQQLKRRDEMYVDPINDNEQEPFGEGMDDAQEGEFDQEEEYPKEDNAVDFDEQPATLELQSSQHFFDFNFEGDKSNSRKLLSSMGFIGFDEEETSNASELVGSNNTSGVIEGETKETSAGLWAAGKKLIHATTSQNVKKEEPEIRKLEELLRFGFINEQQFQELEKEAKEEIERRKAAYKKDKDRRKRIAKKKKKAKLRALEARNATESPSDQANETTNNSNETISSEEAKPAPVNRGRGGASRGVVQGRENTRGRGSGDGERGGRGGTRGGERGRGGGGGAERGRGAGRGGNERGRGAGRASAVRGRGGVERRGGGDRGRGRGGAPRDSEGQ